VTVQLHRLFSAAPDIYYHRTAEVGQTVTFPCHTKLPEDVTWERLETPSSGQRFIYLGGPRDLGHDPRFTVLDENHTLVIYNVTINDSAYYRCVEDSGLGNRRLYNLTVKGIFILIVNFISATHTNVLIICVTKNCNAFILTLKSFSTLPFFLTLHVNNKLVRTGRIQHQRQSLVQLIIIRPPIAIVTVAWSVRLTVCIYVFSSVRLMHSGKT